MGDLLGKATGISRGEPERTPWRMLTEAPARVLRSIAQGFETQFEAGAWNAISGVAENLGLDTVAQFYKAAAEDAKGLGERVGPSPAGLGFGESAVYSGVQSIGGAAPSLAAGAIAGPGVSLALMGATTGGNSYAEARKQGLSPERAALYGVVDGVIEAATERIPATKLLDDVLKGSGVMKTVLSQLKEEIPNEQFAELGQSLNAWISLPENANKPFSAYVAERPSAAAQTFIATLTATVGQSGGAVALSRLAQPRTSTDVVRDGVGGTAAKEVAAESVTAATSRPPIAEPSAQEPRGVAPPPGSPPVVDGSATGAPARGLTPEQHTRLTRLGYDPTTLTMVDAQEILRGGETAAPKPAVTAPFQPDAMSPEALGATVRGVEADPDLRRRRDEMMAASAKAKGEKLARPRGSEVEAESAREFSSTQVDLPAEAANGVREMAARIPDEDLTDDGRETTPHITVQYGLDSDDAAPLREALAGIGPITATMGKTSLFENDDADVVKVDIDSPDLRRVREAIATVLDAPGDTRGDYVPHATVAYVKSGQGQKYAGDATLDGQTITVDRIAFTTRDGETIEIPLGGVAQATTPSASLPPWQRKSLVDTTASASSPDVEPPVDAAGDITEPTTIRLFRAAKDDLIADTASFAESLEDATAYTDNPGYGGPSLFTADVRVDPDMVLDARDLTAGELAERLDLPDPGAIGVDEWVPRIGETIQEAGFDWVRTKESYPSGTQSWTWVGPFEREPEMRAVSQATDTLDTKALPVDDIPGALATDTAAKAVTVELHHGGTRDGGWWTPDAEAADEYARLNEGARVHTRTFTFAAPASSDDVLAAAASLGLDTTGRSAYEVVQEEAFGDDAVKVKQALLDRGYDSIHLNDDFAPSGRTIESWYPLDQGTATAIKLVSSPDAQAAAPPKRISDMTEDEYVAATSAGTHVFDSLYRSGKPKTSAGIFLARDLMTLDSLGNGEEGVGYHGVQFNNPLVVQSMREASQTLLGRDAYEGTTRADVGEQTANSAAILKADAAVAEAAQAAGHDAIVLPREVVALDPSVLPTAEPLTESARDGAYEGMGYDRAKARKSTSTPVDSAPPPAQTGTRGPTRPEATAREGAPGPAGQGRPSDGPPRRRDAKGTRPPARAARDAHPNPDRAPVFAAVLEFARALKPDADAAQVRREFDARYDIYDDIRDAEEEADADPRTLLREIAKRGGIFEKDDGKGQAGELRRLREGQAFGRVGGVNGVLAGKARQLRNVAKRVDGKLEIRKERRGGLPLDVMLQDLQADGRFPFLDSIDDLTNFLDDVQKHGVPEKGLDLRRDLGIDPATAWWETPFGPPAEEDIDEHADGAGEDDTFNPAVYEPRPLSTESVRDAFGLTDEQAAATVILADAMGLPMERIEVVKGGESEGETLPQRATNRLSVLHNLSAANLAWADNMGGIPVPSLGVVTQNGAVQGYGEITLIGRKHLADPAQEPVFDADAYTGRAPKPIYPEVKSSVAQKFYDALKPYASKFGDDHGETWDNLVNRAEPATVIYRMARGPAAAAWFLETQHGVKVEPVMVARPLREEWSPWVDATKFSVLAEAAQADRGVREATDAWKALHGFLVDSVDQWLDSPAGKAAIDSGISRDDLLRMTGYKPGWRGRPAGNWITNVNDMGWDIVRHVEDDIKARGQKMVDRQKTNARVARALKGKEAEFARWVDDKVWSMFGPPYLKLNGRKVPYTLSNIVEAATSARIAGKEETLTYGDGKARAAASKQFRDLEQMRGAAATSIMDESAIEAGRKEAKDALEAYRDAVLRAYRWSDTWAALDGSMRAIARYAKGAKTAANLRNALAREDFDRSKLSEDAIELGMEAARLMLDAPVPYFEAKPQRAVTLDEFAGAVIPKNASPETRAILEKHGLPFVTYRKEHNEAQRKAAVVKLRARLAREGKDTLFQDRGLFDDDADILDTGEAQPRLPGDVGDVRNEERPTPKLSDIEDEFRLTPQYEKRKGVQRALFQMADGSPLPLYQPAWHGSPHIFDEFSLHKIGTGEGAQAYGYGLYFAGERSVAEYYRQNLSNASRGGLRLAGAMPPAPGEGLSDRGWVALEKLSELLVADPTVVKTFSDFDVKGRGEVLTMVRRLLQDRKVLDAVVGLVPVDVVNVFGGIEITAEKLRSDPAMLVDLLPVVANDLVARDVQAMNVLTPAVALAAAKVQSGLGRFDVSALDLGSASGAIRQGDLRSVYSKIPHPSEFSKGRLYKVEIPENEDYLDFDKRITEQSQKVRDFLSAQKAAGGFLGKYAPGQNGDVHSGAFLYKALAKQLGGERRASERLAAAGIAGIRYLDGNSRSKGWRDVRKDVFAELPDDADFDDVMNGIAGYKPVHASLLRSLANDDWLGFDYPSQAITAALDPAQVGSFEMSPALQKAVDDLMAATKVIHNYVVFDDKLVKILEFEQRPRSLAAQNAKASVELTTSGKALIRALTDPDVSSPIHELAHIAHAWLLNRDVAPENRRGITDEDIATTEDWLGVERGTGWDAIPVKAKEKFARGFERYLRDGAAPSTPSKMHKIFAAMREWLTDIYQSLTGSAIDVDITPAMRKVFDRLVTRKERMAAEAQPSGPPRKASEPSPDTPRDRAALIERIVAAARRPEDRVIERFQGLGTDGKWHFPEGIPWGVTMTGERRSVGFVYQSPQGTYYGQKRYETAEAARADQTMKIEAASEEFRRELQKMSDARLTNQAATWIPVFKRSEIVVGKTQHGKFFDDVEVGAPSKALAREAWRLIPHTERLSATVSARRPDGKAAPKKADIWTVKAKDGNVLASGLTYDRAIEVAKDHIESALREDEDGDPVSDTLDTGEEQTRLPGDVGNVRDEERAQPTEDVPEQTLRLSAQEQAPEQTGLGLDPIAGIERAAKKRIKDRGQTDVLFQDGQRVLPAEDRDDLLVVAAAKVARGRDRATFDREMTREFGADLPLADLFTEGTARAKTLADLDIDDYFNFKRIAVSDPEKAQLRGAITETVIRTGRVPKERESWQTIRQQAADLHPDAVKQLAPFQAMQAPFRAVRDAARRRINVLNLELIEARRAMDGVPQDEALAREAVIEAKERDLQGLLDTWMRMRSEDGRNLAMHRMTVDSLETWYDASFWMSKAKRELGLPTGTDLPEDIMRALRDIMERGRHAVETGRDPEPIQLELTRFMAGLRRSSLLETITAIRKAGLLTGPKTHMRNVLGNAAFQVLEETMRVPAVLVDLALSVATGRRTVHGISPRAIAASSYEAATKGVQQAAEVMRTGATKADAKRYDGRGELNSGIRWIDGYVNFVFRTMSASDRVFKSYAFRRSLEEQAALEAINRGVSPLELLAKPPAAMLARAIADAEFATFNNPNAVAQGLQRFKSALSPVGRFVVDTAVPFSNTPSNIVARMLDYTPVGLTGAVGRAAVARAINGAMTAEQQRVFSTGIGRGMTGSALLYLGWTLAAAGLATGIGGDDEGDRNVRDAAGMLSGAIKIAGRWHQTATFSPAGNIVALGASMQRTATKPFRQETQRVGKMAAIGAGLVLEQPMLKGLSDMIDALERPESRGEALVGSVSGSFVPTFVNDIASGFDPYRRTARAEGFKDSLWTGAAARFPGLRNQLPSRLTVFGDPQAQTTRAIWDPTIATVARDMSDQVLRELVKHDVGIGWPQKRSGETAEDFRARTIVTGKSMRERLTQVVGSPNYQRVDDDQKIKMLEDAIRDGRDRVRRMPQESDERYRMRLDRMRPRFQMQ